MLEEEIERIGRRRVNENEISGAHGQFAELEPSTLVRHVITGPSVSICRFTAEGLDNLIAVNGDGGEPARYARRRQNGSWIENEIVLINAQPANLLGLDQTCDFDTKQVHYALDGQMRSLNPVGVHAN